MKVNFRKAIDKFLSIRVLMLLAILLFSINILDYALKCDVIGIVFSSALFSTTLALIAFDDRLESISTNLSVFLLDIVFVFYYTYCTIFKSKYMRYFLLLSLC